MRIGGTAAVLEKTSFDLNWKEPWLEELKRVEKKRPKGSKSPF